MRVVRRALAPEPIEGAALDDWEALGRDKSEEERDAEIGALLLGEALAIGVQALRARFAEKR